MLTFDRYTKESRVLALGCLSLVLLGFFCIALLMGLPQAEDGTLLSFPEGAGALVLFFVGLFFFLPTCNRQTQVDVVNREIVARDFVLFVLPVWVQRFSFSEVTGIEYVRRLPKPWSEDESQSLTVYLKRGNRRLAIMDRSYQHEFAACLVSAWQLGKRLGHRVKKVESPAASQSEPVKRTFDRYPRSRQWIMLVVFSLTTAFLGYLLFSGATIEQVHGDGPIEWGLLAIFLLMLLVVLLLTYNRRTVVDPDRRRIVACDVVLLVLPARTYQIEFNDVKGVEYFLRPPPFYDEFYRTVTIYLVTDQQKLAIMDRENDYQLDSILAAARELAQLLQCPFTDASPTRDKTSDATVS